MKVPSIPRMSSIIPHGRMERIALLDLIENQLQAQFGTKGRCAYRKCPCNWSIPALSQTSECLCMPTVGDGVFRRESETVGRVVFFKQRN